MLTGTLARTPTALQGGPAANQGRQTASRELTQDRAVTQPGVIELTGVSLVYEDAKGTQIPALEGIDLTVRDKEFLVVLGPSGCGKSTMLKVMVGLLQPTTGNVVHRGLPLSGILEDVGMVYQSPLLLPWRTVLDNILLPVEILRLDIRHYRQKAEELLKVVNLDGFGDKMPRQLSGGMQQRAGLCRALVTDPSLLLMDEPFAALDALTRDEMGRELALLWEERKKTVVFVTHSIPEAVLLADRVVIMSPRPGHIAVDMQIDLPRPRTEARGLADKFESYVERIRKTIYSFGSSS